MASRPLPPGRRGRGSRTASALYLPEPKILNMELDVSTGPTSYVEQLQIEASSANENKTAVEPEHESTSQEATEPAPARSVKAFVSSLESVTESSTPTIATEEIVPKSAVPPPVSQRDVPERELSLQPPTRLNSTPPAAATIHESAPVAIASAKVLAPPPAPTAQAPPTATKSSLPSPQVDLPTIHPFHALLPVYSVSLVPEQVECVYDDDAVEMQKTIMKVVKKLCGKDRAKLEDFKINSRLYGNNFMDPHEYLEALAKDFGGNRALQLVPCLLSIQPDYVKRNSLLVATRNYRQRNLAKLEAALDKVEVAAPVVEQPPTQSTVSATPSEKTTEPATAPSVSVSTPSLVQLPVDSPGVELTTAESSTAAQVATVNEAKEPTAEAMEESNADVPIAVPLEKSQSVVETIARCEAESPADLYVPPVEHTIDEEATRAEFSPISIVHETEEVINPEVPTNSEAPAVEVELVEPSQPSAATGTVAAAVLVEVDTAEGTTEPSSSPAKTTSTVLSSPITSSLTVVASPTPSEHSSTSSADTEAPTLFQEITNTQPNHESVRKQSTLNLFGEDIGDDDSEDDDDEHADDQTSGDTSPTPTVTSPTPASAPVSEPMSSTFFDADSLFGESIPAPVKSTEPTPAPQEHMLFGLSDGSAPSVILPPPPRTGLLFGFGTAGDDSDSEFSD